MTFNLEAERALLGSVLLDNSALDAILAALSPADLYSEANRLILESMLDLSEKRRTVDLVTLSEVLSSGGLLDKAGGRAYIASLTDGVPIGTQAAVGEYVRIVKGKSTARQLINASNNVITRCLEGADEPEALIELAQEQVSGIAAQEARHGFQSLREIVRTSFGKIDVLFDCSRRIIGIETGFADLDSVTGGLQRGDLIVIAARPSLGKTALALNIAAHAAIVNAQRVGFFSLEMSKEPLVVRILCSESRVDSHKLRTGFSSRDDWGRMTMALGKVANAPLYIDDTPALTVAQIRAAARRMKAEKGLDLLVVDYLQLVAGGQRRYENRTQEVSHVSRELKAIAKELGVPVVALSQLSRAPDQRRGFLQRPQLSDLRESGSIEQDADVVIFIFRRKRETSEGYDETDDEAGYETVLIVGKQRNGPTADIPVVFLKRYVKFETKAPEDFWDAKAQAANDRAL